MEGHATQMPELPGTIPLGRGLMPEELADYKAKGREWSRLYKEKRRKEFSAEQMEERKMKNRLRQKRFRERQKTREQEEEAARLAATLHQQQLGEQQQQGFDPNNAMPYTAEPAQEIQQPQAPEQHHMPEALAQQTESLVEKRKRLGRERQARFREKKRMRSQSVGAGGGESSQAGVSSGQGQQQQQEVMTLAELQKMSAQLSGYYTGLTQGLSRDEHQAVMRFFLDGIREELGDEVYSVAVTYSMADAQAAAQAQYMVTGQPAFDLHALQAVATAAAHGPSTDMQSHHHMQPVHASSSHIDAAHAQGQLDAHQAQLVPQDPTALQSTAEVTQAQVDAYHRHLAEQQAQQAGPDQADIQDAGMQQAAMDQTPTEGYGAHEAGVGDGHDETKEALSPHLPGGSPSAEQQQTIMYGEQASVTQEMLQQPGNGMHYVTAAPDQG